MRVGVRQMLTTSSSRTVSKMRRRRTGLPFLAKGGHELFIFFLQGIKSKSHRIVVLIVARLRHARQKRTIGNTVDLESEREIKAVLNAFTKKLG